VIKAEMGGKIKTVTQMAAIVLLILKNSIVFVDLYDLGIGLILVSLVLAIFSAVQYTVNFWREI